MAFEVKKIDPLDLQPRKAVGFNLPFSGKAVFNSNYETKDAIKNNLINYFLTGRGERYLNPEFGNRLQNLLFDQLTEDKKKQIEALVLNDIGLYFPRVLVNNVSVQEDLNNNAVQFSLEYSLDNSNIQDEVVINFLQ